MASFLTAINQQAEIAGLKVRLVNPLDEQPQQFYARVPVQLEVIGNFHQLARFFAGVSRLDRIINVENINLGKPINPNPTADEGESIITTSCLTTTFHATKAPAPGAPGAPGAPPAPGGPPLRRPRPEHRANALRIVGPSLALAFGVLAACGSSAARRRRRPRARRPPPRGPPSPRPPPRRPLPTSPINEADFTESDSSRDPFHVFAQAVKPVVEVKLQPQYAVLLEKYSIDELKLVAIVTAADGPRAMFVDPAGKGHVVQRGVHIARGELVKLGAGAMSSYPLHWKIDRIKPNEVVLVREDTLHPEVQPTYREIFLHTDTEKT